METRGEKRAAFAHGRLGAADGTHGMDFAAAGWLPEVFGQAGLGFGTRKGSMKSFKSHRIQMHKTRYLRNKLKHIKTTINMVTGSLWNTLSGITLEHSHFASL
jgi:ribulose 1,5-bisphosphate carboxylase large subunit-like protein